MKSIMLYLRINLDEIALESGFSRHVRNVVHWGTGELEVTVKNVDDFEKAKEYINKSYEIN